MISRRDFLKTCAAGTTTAALTAFSASAEAAPKSPSVPPQGMQGYDLSMPRVRFECDGRVTCPWNIYPGGEVNLMNEFVAQVHSSVKIPQGAVNYTPMLGQDHQFAAVVDLDNIESMRPFPILFMTAEGRFDLSPAQRDGLKKYIEQGGFILMDDCVYDRGGDFFYQSAHKILAEIFGRDAMEPIPYAHEVFKNVYDLSAEGLPHAQGQRHGARGLFLEERLAVFLSPSDLHCAWTDKDRVWFPDPSVYNRTIQMGINILTYALSH